MAHQQTIPTAVRSGQDNSDSAPEISALDVDIKTRKDSVDRWNSWRITFVILGAIAASGLVVTGIVLNSKGKGLSKVQDELSTIKDRNAAADSQTKSLQIAEAQSVAAQANEHAKQLGKETEELRNQNLELQRRINPRFLTTTEQQTILEDIRPFSGHQIIIVKLGDGEAGAYADSIIRLFQEAGWVVQMNYVGMYSPPRYGVICGMAANPDVGGKAITSAFKKAHIELTVETIPAPSSNSWIEMFVGLKPVN